MHERCFNRFALELAHAFGHRFERTVYVGFDDQVQRGSFAGLNLGKDVFQLHTFLGASITALGQQSLTLGTRVGHCSSGAIVGGNTEVVASLRNCRKTQNLHRCRRACFFDLFAAIVDDGAHTTPSGTRHHRVANFERSLVDEHRDHWAATHIELGFKHETFRTTRGVSSEFFNFGYYQQLLEQFVDAQTLLG